jgi:UDP-N-acetylmuramoyl-tripeptide--D-alanyl-D-alanine ligase
MNVISYGNKDTADFCYQIHSLSPEKMEVAVRNKHQNVCVFSAQITGDYNALNVVAAVCIGETFGISTANIQQGIYSYIPTNQRSQLVEKKDYKIWLDCYNANPSSMKASLEGVCHTFPQEKKCLILGDMLELGAESQAEHEAIADLLASLSPFWVIFVGKEMKYAHLLYTGKSLHYEKVTEISPDLKNEILNEGIEFILLKGSRGMGLEKCMDWL